MEIITFKLDEDIMKKMDSLLKPLNFNNRTEFIRESIREKLNLIENDLAMQSFLVFKGAAKIRVSDEKLHQIREKAARDYAKKLGVKLD